ncbi:MAG: NAD+ synthase [bacterium]
MDTPTDYEGAVNKITRFLSGMLDRTPAQGYVVGISGGIDSALAATLAVKAVGPQAVFGLMMPYRTSSRESLVHGRQLIEGLGIDWRQIDISPMIDAYYSAIDDSNRLRAGNKMARERMAILFDVAQELGYLVLGTGNRTEICLGYTTWYGDSACSLNPIGQLYKGEVRQLARQLGILESIITKPPSADLWQNQTDEGEIGVTYEQIDGILRRLIDDGERSLKQLERDGFAAVDVSRVVSLFNRNAFKRRMPEIAPLGKADFPNEIALAE